MTNRECFEKIRGIVANDAELVEFIDGQLASLDKRAAAAKARQDKKRAEGDEIRAKVQEVLSTDNAMIVPEIVAAIADENITSAKVVARLKQLVDAGIVIKEKVKFDAGEKMTYKLA